MRKIVSFIVVICSLLCFSACNCVPVDITQTETESVVGELEIKEPVMNGIRLMSEVSPMALPGTVTVTANVEPKYAIVDLKWELSGIDTPEDYIDMQVAEDKKSATLSAKKAFETEITLTVSSVANSETKATCVLKYRKRVESIDEAFVFGSSAYSEDISVKGNVIDKSFAMSFSGNESAEKLYVTYHPELIEYGIGTVGGDVYRIFLNFTWNATFLSALQSAGLTKEDVLNDFSGSASEFRGNVVLTFDSSNFFKESFSDYAKIKEALETSNGHFLDCGFSLRGSSNSQVIAPVVYTVKVDPESFAVQIGDVTLDKNEVVF